MHILSFIFNALHFDSLQMLKIELILFILWLPISKLNFKYYLQFQMRKLSQPKRAVLSRIDENSKKIQHASDSLQQPYFDDNDTVMRDDVVSSVNVSFCMHDRFELDGYRHF